MTQCSLEKNGRATHNKPMNEDISQGQFLQKFATRRALYVILFGLVTSLNQASHGFFSETSSEVEKRFGLPHRNMGVITTGKDISALIFSTFLTYYVSKKNQPRWIGFGMYSVVLFCLLCALPHFIVGPGEVPENKYSYNNTINGSTTDDLCRIPRGEFGTSIILFVAQFLSGIGGTLCYSVGTSYLDDNVERSKVPITLSFIFFIQILGRMGSSIYKKLFHNNSDTWWLSIGWITIAFFTFVFSTMISMFPTRLIKDKGIKRAFRQDIHTTRLNSETGASFSDFKSSLKRLFSNKILMFNIMAVTFHILGGTPFLLFLSRYTKIMFAQSSESAKSVIGKVGILAASLGLLFGGTLLSVYKPTGRLVAAWNIFVGSVVVLGVLRLSFLACPSPLMNRENVDKIKQGLCPDSYNANYNCDHVKFSPVCSLDKATEFINSDHAECKMMNKTEAIHYLCKQVNDTNENKYKNYHQAVTREFCPVNCEYQFTLFIIVLGVLKFITAAGRGSSLLITLRSVDERDKALALGLAFTFLSAFANIPAPALFNFIFDRSCIWSEKVCSGTSDCLLYDSRTLRHLLTYTSAGFILIAVILDIGVWYSAKNLRLFDQETKMEKETKMELPSEVLPLAPLKS